MELSESVVIEPKQTNITLTVPILNDGILEGNESFSVELVAGGNVRVDVDHVTVWIVDDDGNGIVVPSLCIIMFTPLPQLLRLGFRSLSTWFLRATGAPKCV